MPKNGWFHLEFNPQNHKPEESLEGYRNNGDSESNMYRAPKHAADIYHDELETAHSQTIGQRGPVVLQDGVLHENLETFVHSKITERAVHVKGFGAFGVFQPYQSMAEYTKLNFLQNPQSSVPVTVRFSLAVSTKGTPDTSRNVRGFSTKFYTEDGVFDLLCNHIPVFLVRDAIRFPESIKAFLPSPTNNLTDPTRFWNFVARTPEATHFVTWLYSDVGTVKSLRKIRASSVNTYVWRNIKNELFFVKYHWIPLAGEETIDRSEAAKLAGENPDVAGQDLYDAIDKNHPVEYELRVQLMRPEDGDRLPYDPLDCTKVWDEQDFPLIPVGRMILNKNPDNYMEQVEKVAFSPMNLLDGAELSNDKMLQGRSTVYWDAQRYRLGPEFRRIPINHQENWTPDQVASTGLGQFVSGNQVRDDIPKENDFSQAGQRFRAMSPTEQAHLVANIAAELPATSQETQNTVLGYFHHASPEMANQILSQMGRL